METANFGDLDTISTRKRQDVHPGRKMHDRHTLNTVLGLEDSNNPLDIIITRVN